MWWVRWRGAKLPKHLDSGREILRQFPAHVLFWHFSHVTRFWASAIHLRHFWRSFLIAGTMPLSLACSAVGTGSTRSVKVSTRTLNLPHSRHWIFSCTSLSRDWFIASAQIVKDEANYLRDSLLHTRKYRSGEQQDVLLLTWAIVCWECLQDVQMSACLCVVNASFWRSSITSFPNSKSSSILNVFQIQAEVIIRQRGSLSRALSKITRQRPQSAKAAKATMAERLSGRFFKTLSLHSDGLAHSFNIASIKDIPEESSCLVHISGFWMFWEEPWDIPQGHGSKMKRPNSPLFTWTPACLLIEPYIHTPNKPLPKYAKITICVAGKILAELSCRSSSSPWPSSGPSLGHPRLPQGCRPPPSWPPTPAMIATWIWQWIETLVYRSSEHQICLHIQK